MYLTLMTLEAHGIWRLDKLYSSLCLGDNSVYLVKKLPGGPLAYTYYQVPSMLLLPPLTIDVRRRYGLYRHNDLYFVSITQVRCERHGLNCSARARK